MIAFFGWAVSHYVVDRWSVVHLLGWFVIAAFMRRTYNTPRLALFVACFVAGLLWELLEQGIFEFLLNFHEPTLNRWVADPIVNGLGALVGALMPWKRKR